MSIKVAMIGAGSVVFSKNLTGDILSYPEFKDATLSYMDIDAERLEVGADLCRKVAKTLGANPSIQTTTDRCEALRDADFVINMVQIGGFNSTLVDFEIPRKYGLNFTIADTTGPGGIFRALRTFPALKGLCADMEEVCPKATLLNYSNPMCMNMLTVTRTSEIKAVGLCHSVQATLNELMRYIDVDVNDVAFQCAGINHMAFFQKLEKGGEDLYSRLFEAMNDPKIFKQNKVRFELMKRLGYFVTESSEHNAEYSGFFIPRGAEVIKQFDVPIDEYLRRSDGNVDEFDRLKVFSKNDEPMEVHRSHEYGSTIIHSVTTGQPSVVYGNMVNNGTISNLPPNAIVEAPTLVDRAGLQFTNVGDLPPQLVGYMQPHVTQYELFIRGALEGRRDHIYQACMFDPLTAATLTLDQIVEMCDELIEGHGELLPDLDTKKTLVTGSGKTFKPPTSQELRDSWDNALRESNADAIEEYHVIGPFPADDKETIAINQMTAVEAEFLAGVEGKVDLGASYGALYWKPLTVTKGTVDFRPQSEADWFMLQYAYFEIESVHQREATLKSGSDDGLKIWLNGREISSCGEERGFVPQSDETRVFLKAGVNRFLVKLAHLDRGQRFSISVSRPNF